MGFWGEYADRRDLLVLLMIAALATAVVVLYAATFASMAVVWRSSNYQHGAIVFPVAAYLLWRARKPLGGTVVQPFSWGILALVPLVLSWYVAGAVGIQTVEHLAAVLLIPATVLTFLGWPLFRRTAFPLLFLVIAVPVGDALTPYLMEVTADMSTAFLLAVGVPVHREGQFLSLPGGDFEIADVCSGLAYLTAGTTIALLFAYLTYQSNAKRIGFVVITAAIMVVVNGVRAFIVMWVASASDMRYLARDHVLFGWLLFACVIVVIFYAGARFADRVPSIDDTPPLQSGRAGVSGAYGSLGGIAALCAAAAVLIAGPPLLAGRASAVAAEPFAMMPPAIDGCSGPNPWSPSWKPEFQSPDAVVAATYSCDGIPVDVFVAVYLDNLQGRELISDTNTLLPDDWRRFMVAGRHGFSVHGETIELNEGQFMAPTQQSLVWYWYAVHGSTTTAPTKVKLLQALQLIARGQADGSVYLLATSLDESVEASRRRLALVGRQIAGLPHASAEWSGQ